VYKSLWTHIKGTTYRYIFENTLSLDGESEISEQVWTFFDKDVWDFKISMYDSVLAQIFQSPVNIKNDLV